MQRRPTAMPCSSSRQEQAAASAASVALSVNDRGNCGVVDGERAARAAEREVEERDVPPVVARHRAFVRTLQALIEASPLAVVVSDASGVVRVWNPAAVRLFGWREEEAVGHPNPLLSRKGTRSCA